MNVPELIPIRYEPDYRTRTIGRWRGGQFFASVTGAIGRPECFAVLHRFDAAGRHLDSRIRSTAAAEDARHLVAEWLDALPGRAYGDIAIAPFAVRVEGELFGLVREESEEDDGEEGEDDGICFELYPDGLGFHAPWDGCYDT
ncbi:hypothetical protein ACIPLC_24520 [Kitasatospora sp. NPDC086801]|uniref:hypothetical protein n=1 Tax=Kitasatospora sp. NPDC086801 TaxID=3364066 RepID=UPI003808776B